MKGRTRALFSLAALSLVFLLPGRAWACACCSHEGSYYVGTGRPSEYELSLVRQIRFGPKATLYTAEADPEDAAKGVAHVAESYALGGSLVGRAWKLTFRDAGKTGTLSLPLPAKLTSYTADIHDGQTSPGGGPLLYKEWRFEGLVSGTGFFGAGIAGPTKYLLVLQGRGNACQNAEDFRHWRLQINGRKAEYAFYGELADPQ
ncbi:MAG TPA: hypothetical protein VF297_28520 [Pyrinomonadaceae bacterium]